MDMFAIFSLRRPDILPVGASASVHLLLCPIQLEPLTLLFQGTLEFNEASFDGSLLCTPQMMLSLSLRRSFLNLRVMTHKTKVSTPKST